MNRRINFLLLIMILLLGAAVWFTEQFPAPPLTGKSHFLNIHPEQIKSLTIAEKDFSIVCEKKLGHWELTTPIAWGGDESAIEYFLYQLGTIDNLTIVTPEQRAEHRITPADYGLDTPRARITISDGQKQQLLIVGKNSVLDSKLYLMDELSGNILKASQELADALPLDSTSWRDRQIFHGDITKATKLTIQRNRGSYIQLARQGKDTWFIRKPYFARANRSKVASFLDQLMALRINQFVCDKPTNQFAYSTADNDIKVAIWFDETSQPLFIGRYADNDPSSVYAKVADSDTIYTVPASIRELLSIKTEAIQERTLFPHYLEEILALRITVGDQSVELQKDANQSWEMTEPIKAPANNIQVQNLLDFLCLVDVSEVEELPEEYKDRKPDASVIINYQTDPNSGPPGDLSTIRVYSRQDHKAYIQILPENLFYETADTNIWGCLAAPALSYRSKQVLAMPPEEIKSLTLHRPDTGEQQVVRNTSAAIFQSTGGQPIDLTHIDAILDVGNHLEAGELVTNILSQTYEPYFPSNSPSLTFGFFGARGISKSIIFGYTNAVGHVYTRIRGQDVVFTMPPTIATILTNSLYRQE